MRPSTDDVVLDPQAAHPEFGHLRAALTAQDWRACRAVLDTASLSGRSWLLGCAAEERGIEGLLEYVLQTDPNDSTAAALLGLNLIDIGWAARGTALAMHVGAGQFEIFHDWLRRAETVLIDAAARCPWDPALWTARLMTARGLQLGLAEIPPPVRPPSGRRRAPPARAAPVFAAALPEVGRYPGGDAHLGVGGDAVCPAGCPAGRPGRAGAHRALAGLAQQDLTAGRTYLAGQPVRDVLYRGRTSLDLASRIPPRPRLGAAASTFAMVFALMGDPARLPRRRSPCLAAWRSRSPVEVPRRRPRRAEVRRHRRQVRSSGGGR